MKVTYDPHKDQVNQGKHQVSLDAALRIEWDTLYATEDKRHDYGEIRMVGYAFIDIRLYCVVYTDRGDARRVISLRKANNREKRNYAHNY